MASAISRFALNVSTFISKSGGVNLRTLHTATTTCAARKGTREKARAKKVKVEITKVGFIPHNQRRKDKTKHVIVNKHLDDSFKQISCDDVYPMRYYRWTVYTAEEAVEAHKETHHPTMYNDPEAFVYAQVELNMEAVKKNRYLDNFTKISLLPHAFSRNEQRTILAFCKDNELQKQVENAGATKVGGVEVIKRIQEGEVKLVDYDYVIAHPNILTELVPIRGLMKRKFPNLRTGTLDADIVSLVKKFAAGIQYRAVKDENQHNYACIEVPVGRLNMDSKHIAENVQSLLKDISSGRPKRDGLFITRCFLVSPPSTEKLKIDPFVYISPTLSLQSQDESDDETEESMEAVA